ncbi:hypothetical protein Hanom_Chr01g00089431 [Helianthus anomalus]
MEGSYSSIFFWQFQLAGATLIAPAFNYWWPRLPSNLSQQAFSKHFLQDQWSLRVAHHSPSLTYWWNTHKWFPSLAVIAHSPDILSTQDRELKRIFTAGRAGVEVRLSVRRNKAHTLGLVHSTSRVITRSLKKACFLAIFLGFLPEARTSCT